MVVFVLAPSGKERVTSFKVWKSRAFSATIVPIVIQVGSVAVLYCKSRFPFPLLPLTAEIVIDAYLSRSNGSNSAHLGPPAPTKLMCLSMLNPP